MVLVGKLYSAFTPGLQAARTTYFALFALQHRGQEGAGLVTSDGYNFHVHRGTGLVSQVRFQGPAGCIRRITAAFSRWGCRMAFSFGNFL